MKKTKKTNKKKWIALLVAAVFIVAAIGITWAFWSAGIDGDTGTKSSTVQIGSAERVTTVLNLKDSEREPEEGRLIPKGIPLATGEIHKVEFTIPVEWRVGANFVDSAALDGVEGELTVELDAIMAGNVDLTNALGWERRGTAVGSFEGETTLFEYEISAPSTIIGNANAIEVTLTVSMNIPYDKTDYDTVAGNEVDFVLAFSVTPPEELA